MISAITNRGAMAFMVFSGKFSTRRHQEYAARSTDRDNPLF